MVWGSVLRKVLPPPPPPMNDFESIWKLFKRGGKKGRKRGEKEVKKDLRDEKYRCGRPKKRETGIKIR